MKSALDKGYTAVVDQVDDEEWTRMLHTFRDASIFQTWAYGTHHGGKHRISHLVLEVDRNICAVAQVRIYSIPVLHAGIAYVFWGPLWRRWHEEANPAVFRQMIRALKNEYVEKRGLLLRLVPRIYDTEEEYKTILQQEGFTANAKAKPYRTIVLDLEPDLETIRKNFRKSWLRSLKKAEKNNLVVRCGHDEQLYEDFAAIFGDMVKRKNFTVNVDINEFRHIQKALPEPDKMHILEAVAEGKPVAASIVSALGDTGIGLLAATSEDALKLNASYLLEWHIIKWLKSRGVRWYDLHGIDPEANPGTYVFKSGFRGEELSFIGQYNNYKNLSSLVTVKLAEIIIRLLKKIRR